MATREEATKEVPSKEAAGGPFSALETVAAKRIISYLNHEVRIPLASILGFAESMYDARQSVTERMNCISRIRGSVKHLAGLMDDISNLSRIESGEMPLHALTFSLLPELGEIFSSLQTHAWKKRLELRVDFVGLIPETVHLDAARLRQVLLNVVGEVIEETTRGVIRVEVSMDRDSADNEMLLVFRISGPGREPSAQLPNDRFEPFPNAQDRTGFFFGGHGLGLALARRLARLLGGDVLTTHGGGFNHADLFTVSVRAGSAKDVRLISEVRDADLKLRDHSFFTQCASTLDGMQVLLVEDSADIQILIRHFLKRFGASVEIAENGEEALTKAQARKFDAILMDLQLPLMNGYDATQKLREQGYASPIIALTACAMEEVRDKCLHAGFNEYMTKPIHASALIDTLHRFYSSPLS